MLEPVWLYALSPGEWGSLPEGANMTGCVTNVHHTRTSSRRAATALTAMSTCDAGAAEQVALARQSHTQPMQPPIVLLGQLMQVLCAFKTTWVAYKLCWQSSLLITYPALEEQGPLMSP